jgi:hypothetical protein
LAGEAKEYHPRQPSDVLVQRILQQYFQQLVESFQDPNDPDAKIPDFVLAKLEKLITCGQLEHGFVRLRCESCKKEHLLPFACKCTTICASCGARRAAEVTAHLNDEVLPDVPIRQWVLTAPHELIGLLAAKGDILSAMARIFVDEVFKSTCKAAESMGLRGGKCGALTFIQRFSKSLTVFPHLHVLIPDGVFIKNAEDEPPQFHAVTAPSPLDLTQIAQGVFRRMERLLKKKGHLANTQGQEPNVLEKWFLRATKEPAQLKLVASRHSEQQEPSCGGFTIHANVVISQGDKKGRERLLRYVARPPFAEKQLSETKDGMIRLELRRKGKHGEQFITLEPLRFLRRLCWLIPPPAQPQLRYHGVLAGNAAWRDQITPRPPLVLRLQPTSEQLLQNPERRGDKRTWAQLLARVYQIDIETCPRCGGRLKPIAVIREPDVINKLLRHLRIGPFATCAEPAPAPSLLFP